MKRLVCSTNGDKTIKETFNTDACSSFDGDHHYISHLLVKPYLKLKNTRTFDFPVNHIYLKKRQFNSNKVTTVKVFGLGLIPAPVQMRMRQSVICLTK